MSSLLLHDERDRVRGFGWARAGDVMESHVSTAAAAESAADACLRMVRQKIGCLPVVEPDGKLVGILTERDYLIKVVGIIPDFAHLPLQPVMTTDPETVSPDDTLAFALHKMDVGGYRHLPVVEAGKPVGIISVRDVIRHITRLCKGE